MDKVPTNLYYRKRISSKLTGIPNLAVAAKECNVQTKSK